MVKDILNKLRSRRLAETERAQRDYYKALESEEFLTLERRLKDMYKRQGMGETVDNEVVALESKRTEMLNKLGLKITPVRDCELCGDSGYRSGELCACVKRKIISAAGVACGTGSTELGGIKSCSCDIFPEGAQREMMTKLYRSMADFCEKFPNTDIVTMTFSGGTGTGKTHLVQNLSAELGSKGFEVLYFTAFGLNQLYLKIHTAPIEDKGDLINALLEADMLIIDDLGTENMLRNVTVEYFTNILTERTLNRRHTVITTNMTQEEIFDRYGERVFSRINNKAGAVFINVNGADVRLRK